jgi:ABC-type cobalamin/Fe3+-siderophores transport system ATPase subunit
VIAFDGVTVRYPRAKSDALDGVSLTTPRGAITAIVGPNGSGKSTIVRSLIRRVAPRGGRITIDGRLLTELSGPELARRVAVVTQREDLTFPVLVSDYVALGRFPHLGVWHAAGASDESAIATAMRTAGVDELAPRRVDMLSGGEWQRVRLARALAQGGDVLVLDEPTAFLDIGHEMAVFELLEQLAHEGQTVLLVSHELNLVARFASHMVLLDRGRVVADGTPADVMQAGVLERVYHWPVSVVADPIDGAPTLVLKRSR